MKNDKKQGARAKVSVAAMLRQDKGFVRKYAGLFATAATLVGAIGGMAYVGGQIQETHARNAEILSALGTEKALSQQISKNILLLQREWRDGRRVNQGELSELAAGRAKFQAILDSLAGVAPAPGVPSPGESYREGLDKLSKAFAPMGAQIDILGKAGAAMAGSTGQTDRDIWLAGRKAFSLISAAGRQDDVPNAFIDNPDAFKPAPTPESAAQAAMSEEVTKTANAFNNYAGDLLAAVDELDARIGKDVGAQDARASNEQRRIGYLGAAMFLLTLVYFIRKNILADYAIGKNDRERVAILSNLGEGLFLMGVDGSVQGQVSEFSKRLFGPEFGSGSNVLELLKACVDEKTLRVAQRFVRILATRDDVDADGIAQINPLRHVTMQGSTGEMHVGFHFDKIVDDGGRLVSLLVTAIDQTDEERLRQALELEVARNQGQFALLAELAASSDRAAIHGLVCELMDWIEASNAAIETLGGKSRELVLAARRIAGEAHTFKGRVSEAGLMAIVHSLHTIEGKLLAACEESGVRPERLLNLPYDFRSVREALVVYRSILVPAPSEAASNTPVFERMARIVADQASRSGKTVAFEASGVEPEAALHPRASAALRDALVHIAKNAVIHGIEAPVERVAAGKPEQGRIAMKGWIDGQAYRLAIIDDGAGIDEKKLREKLEAAPQQSAAVAAMSRKELLNMVFADGVSSRDGVDTDSGRGIGLAASKRFVEELGGWIEVNSLPGKACEFKVLIPLDANNIKGDSE